MCVLRRRAVRWKFDCCHVDSSEKAALVGQVEIGE